MTRFVVVPILVLILLAPLGGVAGPARAAPLLQACQPAGYSHRNTLCVVVPARGSFSMRITGTGDTVRGQGSSRTAGTQITFLKVPPPVRARGGFGLRVRATGRFGPLTVSPGKAYRYNARKNALSHISTIRASGLYQVIP